MARNKLADLNNHLFAQLERLGDETLTTDQLADEIKRAGAIDRLAGQVVAIGHLALTASKLQSDYSTHAPRLLGLDGKDV
jgi:hypothetical protein